MKIKYLITKSLSLLISTRGILPIYGFAKYVKYPNDIEYLIHISPHCDKILKSNKLYPSYATKQNPHVNFSNHGVAAIYGFANIPSRIQWYRDSNGKAIKIKLDESTKKILKQRRHDKALLISIKDLPLGYLDLSKLKCEIIDIPY